MHISWMGQTCVKIQTKNDERDAMIIIDPYKPSKGNFPRSFTPDIALFSGSSKGGVTLSQNPFVVETTGEFELKNIVIYSIPHEKDNHIFKFSSENMVVVHLGKLNKKISPNVIEKIIGPDILFVPVGNSTKYLDIKEVVNLVNELEPRIIIPIGHKCDTEQDVEAVSKFITEIGLKSENEDSKVIIKKRDLPQEETQLIVINKES